MSYESPISVWWSDTKIEQLRDEYDNLIVRAVKNVCPNVDKDELIKALEYDRGQYEKGFADGLSFKPPVKSNADRIRAMSDEELAEWIEKIRVFCANEFCGKACPLCEVCFSFAEQPTETLDWLKQDVKE